MGTLRKIASVGKRSATEIVRGVFYGFPPAPLQKLFDVGFRPAAILDIGANDGEWATSARRLFPSSKIHMIEAQPELESALRSVGIKIGATHQIALLGQQQRDSVDFFDIHTPDRRGCSLYEEQTTHRRSKRMLPMKRLDDALAGMVFDLIKLDVQGAELDIIRGGETTVARSSVIITEVSLIEWNKGAPLVAETIAAMAQIGFCLFDISPALRGKNRELLQADAIFVRPDSALRPKAPFF